MRSKGTRYSEDFKKSIVTLHQNGKSISTLAKEYDITWKAIENKECHSLVK